VVLVVVVLVVGVVVVTVAVVVVVLGTDWEVVGVEVLVAGQRLMDPQGEVEVMV
jgi:hypothetical protein